MDRVASTYLKAACTLIGLSGPLPGPIRRQSLRKHLEHVSIYIYSIDLHLYIYAYNSIYMCKYRYIYI